jgi:hypothetical protein
MAAAKGQIELRRKAVEHRLGYLTSTTERCGGPSGSDGGLPQAGDVSLYRQSNRADA